MTKYSKIKKSSFAILALSLILVAVLAFGGTYAYFSDKATATGSAKLGTLSIDLKEGSDAVSIFAENEIVQPNQSVFSSELTVDKGATNINFYLRVKITATVTPLDAEAEHTASCGDAALTATDIVSTSLTGWTKVGDYWYQGANTDATATVNSANVNFTPSVVLNAAIGDGGCAFYMGANVAVAIEVEALQADYLTSNTAAASGWKVSDLATNWEAKA